MGAISHPILAQDECSICGSVPDGWSSSGAPDCLLQEAQSWHDDNDTWCEDQDPPLGGTSWTQVSVAKRNTQQWRCMSSSSHSVEKVLVDEYWMYCKDVECGLFSPPSKCEAGGKCFDATTISV